MGPVTDSIRSFGLFLAHVGCFQKHQVLWRLWGSSFIFHKGALVYNTTVDSRSSLLVYQELKRVELPQFGHPNLISVVWFMWIKSSIFIQFSVIIENGCWRDRRMFRGYIKRNPGGWQSLSLSPLITRGHNGKHLLPPYNAVQITCEHKCSSEQTLLCGSLPSLPQPQSESLFSLLSWPFVTWLWRINMRERSSMWLIPVRYMCLPDWSFWEEEVNEMSASCVSVLWFLSLISSSCLQRSLKALLQT